MNQGTKNGSARMTEVELSIADSVTPGRTKSGSTSVRRQRLRTSVRQELPPGVARGGHRDRGPASRGSTVGRYPLEEESSLERHANLDHPVAQCETRWHRLVFLVTAHHIRMLAGEGREQFGLGNIRPH